MPSPRVVRLGLAAVLAAGGVIGSLWWNGGWSAGAQGFARTDQAAVLRALQAATGRTFSADALCIATPEHFPDLVVIASLVPDAGCRLEGVFVAGRWRRVDAGLLERLGQEALAARGWARADADTRRTLALQFVAEVVGPGRTVLDPATLDARFLGQGIAAPSAEARPDGGVIVRVWMLNTTIAGVQPARVTWLFGPDGTPGR